MNDESDRIATRVANEILPHERLVRHWLKRRWGNTLEVDDVIQEAYCRIVALDSIHHIVNLRPYFFRTAHAVATDIRRRSKVENLSRATESEWADVLDEAPAPDRAIEASQRLARVDELLSRLTWTCRRVIELRRIEGMSQKDTALLMGVSESVVENHIARGLKRVLDAAAGEFTTSMAASSKVIS